MEFEVGSTTFTIEQQGRVILFQALNGADLVEFRLGSSQAVELATKLLFEAQKAVWYAG